MKKSIRATIEFDLPPWMKDHHANRVAARFEEEFRMYMERLLKQQGAFTRLSRTVIRNADYVVDCQGFTPPEITPDVPAEAMPKARQAQHAQRR